MTEAVKNTTPEAVATEAPAAETTTEITETKAAPKKRAKKTKRSVPLGQVHIQATFNNTIISFADNHGNIIAASSAGACGFRGSKKGTAYAAQIAADKAAEIARSQFGLTKVDVFVKGVGLGRDAAIRALNNHEFVIESISDVTGVPHGGVRPKRERRA